MMYKNERGWRYKVMRAVVTQPASGLFDKPKDVWKFKGWYNKQKGNTWKPVRTLPWQETREKAEEDLAGYAARHKMQAVRE